MTELHRDAWFHLVREERSSAGYLVLTRTTVPFASVGDIVASTARVMEAVRASGVDRLLFDVSGAGQGRHDPEFEKAGETFRRELSAACERVAVIVKTAAAKLQVNRLSRGLLRAPVVFQDVEAARRYLTQEAA